MSLLYFIMKHKLSVFPIILCTIVMIIQGHTSPEIETTKTTNVGAILDLNSRMGKEQNIAMQIAVENFNNANFKISIQLIPYNQSLLQIAVQVEALLKENKVEVIIIGIDDWQATSLVAKLGATVQVPVLSLSATSPITSVLPSLQWPFLVQMSHNATRQVQNIASIIKSYHWRKVIVVYEDCHNNYGTISLLTQALQSIGTQIEYPLVLPSSTLTTTDNNISGTIKEELDKFNNARCYSRVFVVLRISTTIASHLFQEAKAFGLMGNDSVWITMGTIMDLLPSFDNSVLLNMEGVIGIKTKFDKSTVSYQVFEANLWMRFFQDYGKEVYREPCYQALLAYDAIDVIRRAKHSLINTSNTTDKPNNFLKEILRTSFTGLSSQVIFNQEDHSLAVEASTKLVNIARASYCDVLNFTTNVLEDDNSAKTLASEITWPGNIKDGLLPKGWVMPTSTKRMKIGVPVAHTYKNFIDYHGRRPDNNRCFPSDEALKSFHHKEDFDGYCIGVFREVVKLLEVDYQLPYELIPFNCSYDDLVNSVSNKTFDAAVGDITIIANRSDIVDFTQPFEESGLSIILPVEKSYNSHGPWIFLQPFTSNMWIVTFFVFLCTMIVVWVLEHDNNSAFRGTWKNQLSNTAWFGFNSLYFAQREKISSKLTRVVVILWLFIVLILSQSYTANLTSMMTNDRLNQTTIDIEMLQRTNAKVGYESTSFLNRFIEDLLRFNPNNTIGIEAKFENFHQHFKAGNISAACLEYQYAKLFLNQYCNQYIMTQPIHRFGGFGFVFPKGSPLTSDVSRAMLTLVQNGTLKKLQKKFLNISSECMGTIEDASEKDDKGHQSSLSLDSFQVLFYTSGATTTLCLMASLVHWYMNYNRRIRNQQTRTKIAPTIQLGLCTMN